MKVAILTLSLENNYGGVIQNYALQEVLRKMTQDVFTIWHKPFVAPLWMYVCSWLKTFFFHLIGRKRKFVRVRKKNGIKKTIEQFIDSKIDISDKSNVVKLNVKNLYDSKAVVVGSDQVWRPKYNHYLEDMYLRFAKNSTIKRIAYAASFGVDEWEYTPKQTEACSKLAKKFDAISVREESGVKLCKEHLGVDATWVLDPTLLLKKDEYYELCKEVPIEKEPFLATYMLDINEETLAQCRQIAEERNLKLRFFYADSKATLSVPEWIAMFRDASYVVTDSFHGTVFSIIFEKEFKCIYNEFRGSARFDSLLKVYYSGKLDEMRQFSLKWLKSALES